MYKCLDCGAIFDEPKIYYETHGFDYGPYERWSCCPCCNGDYEEYNEEEEIEENAKLDL